MKYVAIILAAAVVMTNAVAADETNNGANMTMTIWTDGETIKPLGNPTGQDYRFTVQAGDGAPTFMECPPAGCSFGVVEPRDWRNPNEGIED